MNNLTGLAQQVFSGLSTQSLDIQLSANSMQKEMDKPFQMPNGF